MTRMKKCLLIMPLDFYSMASQMQAALKKCGYETTLCNDRYPNTTLTKIMWKIGITKALYQKTYSYIKNHFLQTNYDLCIIIKGYGVSTKLIDEIHKTCLVVIGYNFDSFAYNKRALKWYKRCDKFATFDYEDVVRYNLPLIELYSAIEILTPTEPKIYDLFVLQKVHSNRLKFLHKAITILNPQNAYIWLYESNRITAIKNFMHSPILYMKYSKYIHLTPMTYDKYSDYMRQSIFTLDYSHPKQSGITMRCFEALSCKTKIITNNTNVLNDGLFDDSTIICLEINKQYSLEHMENIKKQFKDISYTKNWQSRSINDFVNDLLKLQ